MALAFREKYLLTVAPPFDCPSPTRTRPIQSVQVLVSSYIARRPGLQQNYLWAVRWTQVALDFAKAVRCIPSR